MLTEEKTLLEALTRRVDGVVSLTSSLTWAINDTELEMVPPPRQYRGPRWV